MIRVNRESGEAEACCIGNRCLQVALEYALASILGYVKTIEACMRARQSLIATLSIVLNYDEVKRLKAIDWRSITSCRKHEKLSTLIIVPLIKYDLPEPADHAVLRVEPIAISRVLLQFFEVKSLLPTKQGWKLLYVKKCDESYWGYKATHSCPEGIHSRLSLYEDIELNESTYEVLPILNCDRNVRAIRDQIHSFSLITNFHIHRKGAANYIFKRALILFIVVEDVLK